jgi:hypothetical protein
MDALNKCRDWFRAILRRGPSSPDPNLPEAFFLGLPARPLATFAAVDWSAAAANRTELAPQIATRVQPLIDPVRTLWPERRRSASRGLRIVFAPAAVAQICQGRDLATRGDRLLPVMRQADGSRQVREFDRVELRDHAAVSSAAVAAWQAVARTVGRQALSEIDGRLAEIEQTLTRATEAEAAEARRRLEPSVAFLRMAIARIRACAPPGGDPPAGGPRFEVVELDAVAAGEAAFKGLQQTRADLARLDADAFGSQADAPAACARRIDEWDLDAGLFAAAQYVSIAGCVVRAYSPVQKDPFERRLREIEQRLRQLVDQCEAVRHLSDQLAIPQGGDDSATDLRRKELADRSLARIQSAKTTAQELIQFTIQTARLATDPLALEGSGLGIDLRLDPQGTITEFSWSPLKPVSFSIHRTASSPHRPYL